MGSLYITSSSQQLIFPIIRILFFSWAFHLFLMCIECAGVFSNINYVHFCSTVDDSKDTHSITTLNHHTILLSPEAFFSEIILLFVQLSHLSGLTKDLSAVIHSAHAWQEPRCPNFPLSSYFLSLKITQHMCEYLHSSHFSHHPSAVVSLCVWSPSLLAPDGRARSQQPKFSWMLNLFSVHSDLYKYQSQTEHPHPCLRGNWVCGFETDSPVRTGLYSKQLWACRPRRTQCSLSDALWVKFRRDDKSNQRS